MPDFYQASPPPPPHTPKKPKYKPPGWIVYSRTLGLASILIGGFAVTPAYFWWGVGCVYSGITLLATDAYYEPWIREQKPFVKVLLGAVIVTVYSAFTWTTVWINAPLKISAILDSNEYQTGSTIYKIPWSSRFSKLHIIFDNPTSMDYESIDILLNPNEPVAGISQESNFPNVSFIMNTDMIELNAGIKDLSSGKKEGVPLTPLAFDGGYRVRCEKLPKNSQLKIVLAIGRPTGQNGFAINFSNKTHYWARAHIDGTKSLDDYFDTQPNPNSVQIDGEYVAAQRTRVLRESMGISDMLKD